MSDEKRLKIRLDKIIVAMQKVQRKIAADSQPVSMHELGELEKLGKSYGEVLAALAELNERKKVS